MQFVELPEFVRECKRFAKKYKTFPKDLEQLKTFIAAAPPNGNGTKHWNCITRTDTCAVFKVRMHCDSTKGRSFRVIYAYRANVQTIDLLEVYFKGDQENHSHDRVAMYLRSM